MARHEVQKINDVKFFVCPMGFITSRTWELLRLVNDTTDGEGNILHLPFAGSFLEQPNWYRESVRIVKSARAENFKLRTKK